MKKFKENTFLTIKIAVILLILLFCIIKTDIVKIAVYDSVMRCLTIIIPSLYGMMIMSGVLVKSGIIGKVPRMITKTGKFIFGMNGSVFPIFLFSSFAGYPVGAKMLCSEYEKGNINRRQAEIFSGICFGAGPAFIFGCISSQLYNSSAPGKLIMISVFSANILTALLISFTMRKNNETKINNTKINLSCDTLTKSIISGGRSMADICIMTTAFSVITAFLDTTGLIRNIAVFLSRTSGISNECSNGLLHSFLDITSINQLPHNNYEILPYICAVTSFGGICVIMQIATLTSGKLNIKPFIITRIFTAVLSGVICRLIMPYFLSEEILTTAEIKFISHSASSPVPSFLLIIMTMILFSEYERIRKRLSS